MSICEFPGVFQPSVLLCVGCFAGWCYTVDFGDLRVKSQLKMRSSSLVMIHRVTAPISDFALSGLQAACIRSSMQWKRSVTQERASVF